MLVCLCLCVYTCTCACVFTLPVYACVCVHVCIWVRRCTLVHECVCARALGAVRVQKGVCSNCRLVAIPPLTSRWRECCGKVKASGAVLRAGVERGDPGLESTLCGSGGWAVWPTLQAAPRRTSRASAAGLPPFLGDGQGWFLHPP